MSIVLDLAPEDAARLQEQAARLGEDAHVVAAILLADALRQQIEDPDAFLTQEDRARLQEGIRRGLADEAAGRVKPLSQVITEARDKHDLPDDWPFGS